MLKVILKIGLVLLACVLIFFLVRSICAPLEFNKFKQERYLVGVERLMKIRDAQVAYKDWNKKYASTFDSLIAFIDTGKIAIVERRDTTVFETDNRGLPKAINKVLKDTTGLVSIKDSIFRNYDYKDLGTVMVNDKKKMIELVSKVEELPDSLKELYEPQVYFRARVSKRELLDGATENNILVSINNPGEDIKGEYISVGDLNEVSTDGNWTKDLEAAAEEVHKQ